MSEHDEQVAVFQTLALNERKYPFLKWIYAVPNGGARHPAVAGKLKAEGVKPGISDICIPIPKNGFNGAYIEMKFGKNTLTVAQAQFLEFVQGHNFTVRCFYSATPCLKFIEDYLGITLQR